MRIIVLFNLRPGVDEAAYEKWAEQEDMPAVARMKSVDSFTVHRSIGLFGSDKAPPYRYIEVVDVNDAELFGQEAATETMKKIAARFQELGDNPTFIITEPVGAKA
jgi:hypothetical protein